MGGTPMETLAGTAKPQAGRGRYPRLHALRGLGGSALYAVTLTRAEALGYIFLFARCASMLAVDGVVQGAFAFFDSFSQLGNALAYSAHELGDFLASEEEDDYEKDYDEFA